MESKIIKQEGNKLTIQVEIELDSTSMLNSEEQIAKALNSAGIQATKKALEQFDTDGSPIDVEGETLTSKGKEKKKYQVPYGDLIVARHVYQTSKGGRTYCPLEKDAKIIHSSSPHFAKQISSKYSNLSAKKVQTDLSSNHYRNVSQDFITCLSNDVGKLIEQQESNWSYALPPQALKAKVVSIGRDGTTMYIRSDGYRETMNGTISFYDDQGNRLHTIYMAQAPEYGKTSFNEKFEREIIRVKHLVEKATYVGLADGAKDNWTFLEKFTEVSIIDFWHASEYLTLASKACSKSAYERKQWLEQARHDLRYEADSACKLLKQMKKFRRKHKLSEIAKEGLERAITYFSNHLHQMEYSEHANNNLPIGSGVTEAACKVIVKERLCQSGMKWRINGAQNTLNIRALSHSDGRWKQFWNFVNNYDFSLN